ncbi:major facilitator superfamily domain-containing protein [Plectosphaerella plurivora]|uniref:Major facilitator superfamily domain-containing protein n=1 Tax=Plectosphaerella plurivora TaxID=936078 RepID=A0A9P8V6H2_9PEZI|nr:major facilitator superfamily domain-containing protein [Plectosphaerella plurivora]
MSTEEVESAPIFPNLSREDAAWLAAFPDERKKAAVWKVDIRLIPLLTLLYLFSFIDRANIGNANIEGMSETLGLTGTQYNIALSIFFIPYVLLEVPSNYVLNKFKKPSLYIGTIIMAWGTMTTLLGTVKNFGGLVAVRFMLGVAEAGFFPGAVLIISKWYVKNETQTRIALFYTASALAGAFSGLLAFGIAKMDGVGNYEGWRWIFILEGIATVIAGAATFFLLIDSPASSGKWLDADEIRYLELRQLAQNGNKIAEKKEAGVDWKILRSVLCDWQIYLQALIYWSNTVPNNALKFTMPRIIRNMGYTSSHAQLLTIGPYCAGAVSAYLSAIFADRFTWRMPFIVGPQLLVVTAYAILFPLAANIKDNIPACFFAVVLACIGLYPINPGGNAWTVNNLAGQTKRAMGIAYMICLGNLGGIAGSYIFIEAESPRYPTGFGASLGFAAAGVGACFALEAVYYLKNKKKAAMSEVEIREKYTDEELDEMGDRSPLFMYTL